MGKDCRTCGYANAHSCAFDGGVVAMADVCGWRELWLASYRVAIAGAPDCPGHVDDDRVTATPEPRAADPKLLALANGELADQLAAAQAEIARLTANAAAREGVMRREADQLREAQRERDELAYRLSYAESDRDRASAERDGARIQLAKCYALSGADADGNDPSTITGAVHLYPHAVEAVAEMRKDYDDAQEESRKLTARVRELEATVTEQGHVIAGQRADNAMLVVKLESANGAREGAADFARGVGRVPAGLPFHAGRSDAFMAGWFAGWDRAESIHMAARISARKEALEEAAKMLDENPCHDPAHDHLWCQTCETRQACIDELLSAALGENPDG